MITYIDVNDIYPHPDNPRKDLGDLTELAESIKTSGILQNLTVVEAEGSYRAVIGHRRLAAAKLAGLTEVPCVIAEMDHKTQVATMLLENMQRSDLTVYEQAQGFQMMMSLGETAEGIAKATGFSEVTIRRRVKLLELDDKKFKEAQERGGTLMDYAKLNEIEDLKARNKVLDAIGTSNFEWHLRDAISNQNAKKNRPLIKAELEGFAMKISDKDTGKYEYEKYIVFSSWKAGDCIPKDAKKTKYFYTWSDSSATLYKERAKGEKKKADPKEKAFRERETKLKELTARAYESRYEFVTSFSAGKTHQKEIMAFVMQKLLLYGRAEMSDLLKMFAIEKPARNQESVTGYQEQEDAERSLLMKQYEAHPERTVLVATYLGLSDGKSVGYYNAYSWQNEIKHKENKDLNRIYDALISLGYEMSDEEKALRDGTHELLGEVQK